MKRFIICTILLIAFQSSWSQTIKFKDVTAELAVPGNLVNNVSAYGHGVIMADITRDGKPDIYISNAVRYADQLAETMYISTPTGYQENDKARHVEDKYGWTGSHGLSFFDYDNDGDYDIYNATTDDRNRLYENDGNGFFADVTDDAKLPYYHVKFMDFDPYNEYGYGTRGVVAFDAENDGDMDLLAVNWGPAETRYSENDRIVIPPQPNEFYRNNGDGTFSVVDNSGLTQPPNHSYMGTQGVVAGDIDQDNDVDILIIHRNYTALTEDGRAVNGFNPEKQINNQLMINNGHGIFTDETVTRGLSDSKNDANGASFADYDNDGDLDIFVAPKDNKREFIRVYRNRGNGYFDEVTMTLKIRQWGFSTFFLDADNDGDLDIIAPKTRDITRFYLNNGDGTFTEKSNIGVEVKAYDPRGGAVGDIDNDGDVDLYFADANKDANAAYSNRLYRNELKSSNRWLKITGRGPNGDMGGFGTKIWVYDQGYCGDVNHLVGYREVLNAYGYLCQDDPVQHFGLAQRDTVDVLVRLLNGDELHMLDVQAGQRLYFSKPHLISAISGANQTGLPNSMTAEPLVVEVKDRYGNLVYGAPVIFTSDDSEAEFVPSATIYSDQSGRASVYYRSGNRAEQHITAQCQANPSSSASFLVTIAPTELRLQVVSGNDQKTQAGYAAPEPLKVRVVTANGYPASGQGVVFQVTEGAGRVNDQTKVEIPSDSEGYAQVIWKLGATPSSTQRVEAALKTAADTKVIFSAMTFGPPSKLVWKSSVHFDGIVNTLLSDTLKAVVTDQEGNPLRDVLIRFQVTAGGGLVNGQAQIDQPTAVNGAATALWKLGTVSGIDNQSMTISADRLQNSPVTIIATALPAQPYQLVKISGDSQIGELFQTLPQPLTVAVRDTFGNGIKGHEVIFALTQGNGKLSSGRELINLTDDDGVTETWLTTGSDSNYTVRATAKYNEKNLAGSPVVFKLYAEDRSAAKLILLSNAEETGLVGTISSDSVKVRVVDAKNRPVVNHPVRFNIIAGSSRLSGNTSELEAPSDDDGIASCAIVFGESAEKSILTIRAEKNGELLQPGVIEIILNAQAGPPTREKSEFSAPNSIIADGQTRGAIHIILKDAYGNPIADQLVQITSSGIAVNVLQQELTTDAEGQASTFFTSLYVGEATLIVSINNQPFMSQMVNAVPGPPAQAIAFGDKQSQKAGEVLPQPIAALIMDALGHPIAEQSVLFSVISGRGKIIEPQPGVTNASGIAYATWQLGPDIGLQYARAVVDGIEEPLEYSAEALPHGAARLSILSGDIQIAAPNQTLPDSFVVQLADSLDNPMPNVRIIFSVQGGVGETDGYFISASECHTDDQGKASALFHTGNQTGLKTILADAGKWGQVQFSVLVLEQRSFTFVKLSPDGLTAEPQAKLPISILMRDEFQRPAIGEPVIISTTGGGKIIEPLPYMTQSNGQLAVTWQLGFAGTQSLEIRPLNGVGSTRFTAIVANSAPQFISPAPLPQVVNFIAGEAAVLTLKAKDDDNEKMDYDIKGMPDGAQFQNLGDAVLIWTPEAGRIGHYDIIFYARDPHGAQDSLRIDLRVSLNHDYFSINRRSPLNNYIETDYDQIVDFELDAATLQGVKSQIIWYIGMTEVGAGEKLSWTFTQKLYPDANQMVFAYMMHGGKLEMAGWQVHLNLPTRVKVDHFSAQYLQQRVQISWNAADERQIQGYMIEKYRAENEAERLTIEPILCDPDRRYHIEDDQLLAGETYRYCLLSVNEAGREDRLAWTEISIPLPEKTSLAQNYPNPFNPTTTIRFQLAEAQVVHLAIYNLHGQVVKTLCNAGFPAGAHKTVWDGQDEYGVKVPSGIYYYRLTVGDYSETRKLSLLK